MATNGNASSLGLRNWRGQIVEPLANFAAADVASVEEPKAVAAKKEAIYDSESDSDGKRRSKKHKKKHSKKKDAKKHRRRESEGGKDEVVFVKDEFGRDVPLEKSNKRHKKPSSSRSRSRSRSAPRKPRRRSPTPPPADPYRPQLDEDRYQKRSSRRRSRSRSQEKSSRRHHRERSRSRSRSRDRGHRDRRSSRRSRSKSTDRAWTHDGFQNRSPSPMREVQAGYRPEPEQWVSRAGGVYLPRKAQP